MDAAPFPDRVGLIGLGHMGRPMAHNLRRAGFPLVVHNRSRAPVDALVAAGASAANSPVDLGRLVGSGMVLLALADARATEQVAFDENGLVGALAPGALIVDLGTAGVEQTRRWAAAAGERGVGWLDAPVSGGQIGAEQATLSIMVGGEAAAFARARPILTRLGSCLTHLGPTGAGQATKLANQIVVGVTLTAVAEAFALAQAAGADLPGVRTALLGGFAASRILEQHGQRMIDGNFRPGGPSSGQHRTIAAALELAETHGLTLPVTVAAQERWRRLLQLERGGLDHSAIWTLYDRARGDTISP